MSRTIIHYVALLSVLLLSSGCNKSSEDEPFDFYFVRYTAAVTAGESVKITYRNGDGKNISVNQECPDGKYQVTVGPVLPGFEAVIVASQTIGSESPTLSIEVSYGATPFVMKAQKQNAITLNYTVGE